MRVRAGSGATSGRDVFAVHRRRRGLAGRRGRSAAGPGRRRTPAGSTATRTRWTTTRPPLFDDGNGNRILLGSLGLKAAAGDNTVLLPPARVLRHADRGRGRRAVPRRSTSTASRSSRPRFTAGAGPVGRTPPPAAVNRNEEFAVATFNVENLYDYRDDPFDGCDFVGNTGCPGRQPAVRLRAGLGRGVPTPGCGQEAGVIVGPMKTPDIILIQEAEDQDICTVAGRRAESAATSTTPTASRTPCRSWRWPSPRPAGPPTTRPTTATAPTPGASWPAFLYRTDRVTLAAAGTGVLSADAGRDLPLGRAWPTTRDVQNPKSLNAVAAVRCGHLDRRGRVQCVHPGPAGGEVHRRRRARLARGADAVGDQQPLLVRLRTPGSGSGRSRPTTARPSSTRSRPATRTPGSSTAATSTSSRARTTRSRTSDADTPSDQLAALYDEPGCTTCGRTCSPTRRRRPTPTPSRARPRRWTTSSSTRPCTATWCRCGPRTSTPAGRPTSRRRAPAASATTTRRWPGSTRKATLTVNDVTVVEGDSGHTTPAVFTATLSRPLSQNASSARPRSG